MDSFLPIAIVPMPKQESSWVENSSARSTNVLTHIADHFFPHARNNYHPHIFKSSTIGLLSGLLVTLKIFTIVALAVGPITPAYSSAITPANIISLTNASRESYSLASLTENTQLDSAAQTKANDMLAKGYFSHNTPDGKTPWDFIMGSGYNYLAAGENLAVNFTEAENVETAWMNSPGHKANILNKTFQEIGIGIAQGVYQGHSAVFVVQMFGTPMMEKVAISENPTMVQKQSVPVPVTVQATSVTPLVHAATTQGTPAVVDSSLPAPDPIVVKGVSASVVQNQVQVTAETSSGAVKVLAHYGQEAVMLEPKGNNLWQGSLPFTQLVQNDVSVKIEAFDILGRSATGQAPEFAGSTPSNFNPLGAVKSAHISLAGISFDPNNFQERFYLLFIVGMLVSMIIAIGMHRHIQHIAVVANGAFVVVLAVLLWSVH